MIQLKCMLAVFQKIPFYYNFPSKHTKEQCLNADFLTGVQGVQKKCMFEVEIASIYFHVQIKALEFQLNSTQTSPERNKTVVHRFIGISLTG